jgi:creatinine amidohydrolase
MKWELLSAPDFANAVKEIGVCVLPLGVLERHSDHLPLGTDTISAHEIACQAAEREPCVVFPMFYFGQIYEARCFPGTINLSPKLLFQLFEEVLDEIGRNGFRKIIIFNWHGGNFYFLRFLAQSSLWKEKNYLLYLATNLVDEGEKSKILESDFGGHADEEETSIMLHLTPEYVRMDQVPDEPGYPKGRMRDLPNTFNALWWYADYPEHYAGDARTANKEKGSQLVELNVSALSQYIALVKNDQILPNLADEFFRKLESD